MQEYNKEKFVEVLGCIRKLTTKETSVFVPSMGQLAAEAGVVVLFVRELQKASVSGATR